MSAPSPVAEADLDRARELASIGAGHAANALARLTGRTCEMQVPTVRLHGAGGTRAGAGERGMTGVLFEVEGGPGGVLALLFTAAACERLLARVLGSACALDSPLARSALCEVGNILASHAANALGATLGVTMLPSVPMLALDDARVALADLLARRGPERPDLLIESEICDRARELCSVFVFVPDRLREADG